MAEIRLLDAPQKYDFENEQQFRRSIEAFSRKPLTLYSENGLTARVEATKLEVYSTFAPAISIVGVSSGYTVPTELGNWNGSTLVLGRQDNALEGGQVTLLGGGNAGTPYRDWNFDSFQGVLRLFETGNVRHQFNVTDAWFWNANVGDAGHGQPWAAFAHVTRFNTTDYALVTKSDGLDTRLNAAVGGSTYLCIGNVQKFQANTGAFRPVTDSALDLGGNNPNRFRDLYLGSAGRVFVNDIQVLSTRKTGWTAATNTKTRTTFDTTTVTLPVLAAHVGALIDDLISHGAIGA